MEKNDEKIDELLGMVRDNSAAIGELTTVVKKNVFVVDGLVTTADGLTKTVDGLTENIDKLTATVDDLALMTKNGFDADQKDFVELKNSQIDIKARLENLVYRFEFSALERRVEELELKLKGSSL